jgi:hypothetical protein
MSEMLLVTQSVDVPPGTGVEGFVHTVRSLLKLSLIQSISINARGKVTYERFVDEDEKNPIKVDYSGVEPWYIARNAPGGVEELALNSYNAAVILCAVLDRAMTERLHPIAFVASPNTVLWDWYGYTTGTTVNVRNSICGVPIYTDRHVPDSALILCGSYAKDGAIIDTQKAYKVEMDYMIAPKTEVEVLNVSSSSKSGS